MNQAFLFMNWVIDHSSMQSPQELRDLLTPQLWDDFIRSDDSVLNTSAFVHSVKDKVVVSLDKLPSKNKKNAKTQDSPVSEEAPIPEEGLKKVKKPRVSKPKTVSTSDTGISEVDDTVVIGLPNDEFQEIQLQLVHLDGQPAFIDNQHNIFQF